MWYTLKHLILNIRKIWLVDWIYASYTPRGWTGIEVCLEIKYQPRYSFTETIWKKKQTCKHPTNDLHTNAALDYKQLLLEKSTLKRFMLWLPEAKLSCCKAQGKKIKLHFVGISIISGTLIWHWGLNKCHLILCWGLR